MIALIIGYCCKKTDFDDDHVFQEEELPTIFYDPDDPPSTGIVCILLWYIIKYIHIVVVLVGTYLNITLPNYAR